MSKGSKRRPCLVSNKEYANNYDRIFNGIEPETPVECTAIVKRSDVWPMSLDQVDLTKMDHPTACKYLVEGMEVKVLRRAEFGEGSWRSSWVKEMDNSIGKRFIITNIDKIDGIHFNKTGFQYPAFCLQIIEQENNNE